jgi:hypothetical protein
VKGAVPRTGRMVGCERRGASHRKKGGHVTPKLGTAERQTAASMFTQVNLCYVNRMWTPRWMTALSNDDASCGKTASKCQSRKRVEAQDLAVKQ